MCRGMPCIAVDLPLIHRRTPCRGETIRRGGGASATPGSRGSRVADATILPARRGGGPLHSAKAAAFVPCDR